MFRQTQFTYASTHPSESTLQPFDWRGSVLTHYKLLIFQKPTIQIDSKFSLEDLFVRTNLMVKGWSIKCNNSCIVITIDLINLNWAFT